MIIRLDIKKVGNHWYPNVTHFDPNQIALDPKLEELLNILDETNMNLNCISVYFVHIDDPIGKTGILQFDKTDIERYLTTEDTFEINAYVDNYHFYISSELYFIIEKIYKVDFHKKLYKLEIW